MKKQFEEFRNHWLGAEVRRCYENYGQLAEASADGFEKIRWARVQQVSRRRWKR